MDAVSNVGVWMDKIYMGEKRRGEEEEEEGWVISLKHSGGSQTGMGSMISYKRYSVCIFVHNVGFFFVF